MAGNSGQEDCVCGCPLTLIEDSDGKQKYLCTECGMSDKPVHDEPEFSIEVFDHGTGNRFIADNGDGDGAKVPDGFRNYTRDTLSNGRKAASQILNHLCLTFSAPQFLKKDMITLLRDKKLKSGRFEAMAYAIFFHIYNGWNHKPRLITIKEVADIASTEEEREEEAKQIKEKPKKRGKKTGSLIKVRDIKVALKKLEKHTGLITNQLDDQLEPPTEEDGITYPKWIMPVFNGTLKCPFLCTDVSPRVIELTEKILEVTYRRCISTPALTFMPLAASFLAYQSCFFYRSPTKPDSLPGLQVNRSMIKNEEFLATVGCQFTKAELSAFRKNMVIIRNILKDLLGVMTWIRPSRNPSGNMETPHVMTRRYLVEILRFSNWSIEYLFKKEEAERGALPFIPPPPPKELTDAERAALESTELSDKDLTEAEANEYLRDPEQVEALEKWTKEMSGSDDTDDETDGEEE